MTYGAAASQRLIAARAESDAMKFILSLKERVILPRIVRMRTGDHTPANARVPGAAKKPPGPCGRPAQDSG